MIPVAGVRMFWGGCLGGMLVSIWFLLINAAYKVNRSNPE
jgi:hypothetical protein